MNARLSSGLDRRGLIVGSAIAAWLGPASQQIEKRLSLTPELQIGQAHGPPEYAFGQLGYMAVTSGGGFFLFDYSDTQIRRYDASGRFVDLVGRSGAGPGEYRQIMGMAVQGDSVLIVYDPSQRRITVFDTNGVYRRSLLLQRGAFYGPKAFFVDQAGRVYVRGSVLAPVEGVGIPSQFFRVGMDGVVRDSIPVPAERGPPGAFVLVTADGGRENFHRKNVFTLLPSGEMVTANTGRYRFTVTTARFGTHIIERPFTPIPITGEERNQWEAFARYFATRGDRQLPVAEIPRVKPAFRDILADPTGRIWVNLYTTAEKRNIPPRPAGDSRPLLTMREVNVYDLFDLRGRYLGRLSLPPQSMIMAVTGDRVWVKTEAEGGEFVLTRYRIGGLPPS
jgi:hypothetical protein